MGRSPGAPVAPPITPTSIYVSAGTPDPRRGYGRAANPGWELLEEAWGRLEGAEAVLFSSGQAASLALLFAFGPERRRIVLGADGYYNTRRLIEYLAPFGFQIELVDMGAPAAVESALRAGGAVLWLESPSNPLLRVFDLSRLAELARARGAPMVVDNTLATPVLQRPLDWGATATITSLTKAASGHSDLILGIAATARPELLEAMRSWRTLGGAIASAFDAWLALRGLRTLPLRLRRQSESARLLARRLRDHPRIRAVHYPDLEGPDRALAVRQMPEGFGPMLSFELDGGAAEADVVVAATQLIVPATSFGGVESTWERRARWPGERAPESLVRLSVGIEPMEEILADIERSLDALR